jgi:TonB family protein
MQRIFVLLSIATALVLPASAETNLLGALFRAVTEAPRIKVISDDELEFTPDRDGANLVCKYSRDGDSLRVVATVLGSTQAIYFKFVPEGLQSPGGTILYDVAHIEAASKAAAAERERRLDATVAAAVAQTATVTPQAKTTRGDPAVIMLQSVRVNIPRGEVIIPRGTKLRLLSETAQQFVVDYDGFSVPVPTSSAAVAAATPIPPPPSVAPMLSGSAAKAFAVAAPRPDYPYEARSRKITGSGVCVLTVDTGSGAVTDATMEQSIGNPILDNSTVSAFRRWRFKPGTVAKVRMPIIFTMTGASY